ncbi:MAG TPA: right-handed parallel beta-helix repeat-containing protein [Thermoanaerobaculia bacterium]|nr:right-handed parallel beta-helix repeat-containing protein [Thermoanaerobaculia bacterium]
MRIRSFLGSSAACLVLVPALAQAAAPQPRTFVSAKKGSDAANCSRTSPCRTFERAIAATTPGGEVVVLDSGGYGAVTISQAVSLEAPDGVYAGMTVSTGDGITIATGASDVVVLRGLTLVGGSASGNGITVASGGTVRIEHCTIRGFGDFGIFATEGTFPFLYVDDSTFSESGNVSILITGLTAPEGFNSGVAIDHCRFEGAGLLFDAANSLLSVSVTDTVIADARFEGIHVTGSTTATIDRCLVKDFGDFGVVAGGSNARVFVSNSTIRSVVPQSRLPLTTGAGAFMCSFGNNAISDPVLGVTSCPTQ